MIATMDLPIFDKGDIITSKETTLEAHSGIVGDDRFLLIEVEGITKAEAEALLEPLTINQDGEQVITHARSLTVDVDALLSFSVVDVDYFLSLITQKAVN